MDEHEVIIDGISGIKKHNNLLFIHRIMHYVKYPKFIAPAACSKGLIPCMVKMSVAGFLQRLR